MRETMSRFAEDGVRQLLALFIAGFLASCGSSPSTAPSPVAPSLLGNWTGTLTLTLAVADSTSTSRATCGLEWSITAQTAGLFSGTWTLARPADVAPPLCAPQSGSIGGTVSANGNISDVAFERLFNLNPQCSSLSGSSTFSGLATAGSITAESRQRIQCPTLTTPVVDNVNTIALTKR